MAGNAANQAPTFDSEFDTLDVSGRGQWTPNMPWATADGKNQDDPSEAGFYVNPNFAPLASASPFSVTNGVLDLATKPVPAGLEPSLVDGKPYVSGLLQTAKGFSQLYGYFEMRAELPAGNGVGAAFWLLPVDGSWPPELDVMESLGQDPSTVYQTVHGGTSSASVPQQQVAATVAGGTASGFHTYGVDWEADKTTFYVDGKQTGQFDTPASMHKPMYMILSDNSTPASDVKWGKPVDGSTPFPADFCVDYVRAYASMPALAPGGSPAPGGAAASATAGGGTGASGTGASGSAAGSTASNLPAPPPASVPPVVGSGADTLVLNLSEDAYGGDAQFTVTVDGKAVGDAQAVTASHGQGQSEAFTFEGDWSGGPHAVGVSFVNDRYDGTAATDRNLYIDGATFDGAQVEGKTPLYGPGTVSFGVGSTNAASPVPAGMLSVTDGTGAATPVPLIAAGSRTDNVGGGTISQVVKDSIDTLTTSGAVRSEAATLGGGTRKLILVNPRSMTVTGGSGADTVSADSGSNRYVAGSGSLDVTGGPGADDFVLHAGAGSLTIEDFDAGKGDRLLLDKSLQGSLKQASDGHGGTLLSVGAEGGTIDLINHGTLSQSSIQFI